ncbi:four helix bundle protein [Flavobacterium sp.]|uniref:four helix bundle protein n=1 Tax=Flavobacterium sp. TaxID=239 RepID=UPI003751EAB7
MRDFKKYEIWQLGHSLTLQIYKITSTFPKEELYGLTSQIRRATSSIPTNISEGCGRNSDKEFNQFLNIALGSASETKYLLILSKDLNYINLESFEILEKENNIIKSKIYKLKQILIQQQEKPKA